MHSDNHLSKKNRRDAKMCTFFPLNRRAFGGVLNYEHDNNMRATNEYNDFFKLKMQCLYPYYFEWATHNNNPKCLLSDKNNFVEVNLRKVLKKFP